MRAVVQRVKTAKVMVDGEVVGEIAKGVLIFLGVGVRDTIDDADYLASKIVQVLSNFLCKIFLSQFFEERQVLTHFSYRV